MMSTSLVEGDSCPEVHADKPKKRVITAARQEQNRAAQRAYRERQKERKKRIDHDGRTRKLAPRPSSESSSTTPNTVSDSMAEPISSISPSQISIASRRGSASPLFLADPMNNAMQTSQHTIWVALLHNAICLGFNLDKLSDCSQPYMSPFYRSIAEQDHPGDLIASTFNSSIPIHLQPTMAQIMVPHHASLDLIPIPLLRERAIMKSFAMPNDFNLWDLKLDVYTRHALVVRRHRAAGTCQPWDQKNWEATPWFVKKWSTMID